MMHDSFEIRKNCSCFTCPNSLFHKKSIICIRQFYSEPISIGKSMTLTCDNALEYFNSDLFSSYEKLKEKLDLLSTSNEIKDKKEEKGAINNTRKLNSPSSKDIDDYYNK